MSFKYLISSRQLGHHDPVAVTMTTLFLNRSSLRRTILPSISGKPKLNLMEGSFTVTNLSAAGSSKVLVLTALQSVFHFLLPTNLPLTNSPFALTSPVINNE